MANKQNFKPDEWTKILESTMLQVWLCPQRSQAAYGER